MKRKQRKWLAMAAIGMACVSGSYVMGACYVGAGYDWCRNVLSTQGISYPSSMTIGGVSCTLDFNSENDELTLWGMTVAYPNTGWAIWSNTNACHVAYDCNGTLTLAYFDATQGTTLSGPWGVVELPNPQNTGCPYWQ